MFDVLNINTYNIINCLDHGYVRLIDVMPRLVSDDRKTADEAIIQSARVSYGLGLKSEVEDRSLIRYLMRHHHHTPLEMVEFKFDVKLPIFVARQWIRHRISSYNEISGRYSEIKDNYYIPDKVRSQSIVNKQGSDGVVDPDISLDFVKELNNISKTSYDLYKDFIENGVSKELSRINLPINYYTQWYWKVNLRSLLNFLSLRCDKHAQYEIRVYADAILQLIKNIVPWTIESWEDYDPMRGGMLLSRLEIDALIHNKEINVNNKREREEWLSKLEKLKGYHV
jgi:thymidylate synthase (FAD)